MMKWPWQRKQKAWPHVRIVAPKSAQGTRVWIDGKEQHHIRHVQIDLATGEPTSVLIELYATVEFNTDAEPELVNV